jgi:hypothetical protein
MHSETFRSLSEALAAHLPHLSAELVRTEDGTVVARVDAVRNQAKSVVLVISFEAPPEPEPAPKPHHDPNRWKYVGDPLGAVFVNRSGHTPTASGWQSYPINHGGDHYAGAPGNRHWTIARPNGERLATFGDLPAVIRFLCTGGY